ncbi:MAG: alanyl-tRNA editing protein [Alphaproteobacteria bacterium]|nr:alanyl-tRNA editing protein [Alphaproteobacteria bacterium]
MPTELIFRDDPYAQACEARVIASGPEGVVLDRTVFYAQGGGQPGDTGRLVLADGTALAVANAVKGAEPDTVLHQLAPGATPPAAGTTLRAEIDWARRHRLMRVHTSMHLLCSMIPGIAVTGGSVGDGKGRLDFDLPAAPDKDALNARLAELIAANHAVGTLWITEEELNAKPEMVRTLSVKPPMGSGRVRLVRIGPEAAPVDLQPCGGTHVRATGEIGRAEITKIENKGRQNRRINLVLVD